MKNIAVINVAVLSRFQLKRNQYSGALNDYQKLSRLGIRNEEVQVFIIVLDVIIHVTVA